mmetsp:Transcript_54659/g.175290  ORF Transcript_54659/g.175290 Transcript_54659/m.175290 type:complete len:226 (-) Transcript_54659:311-988(-)
MVWSNCGHPHRLRHAHLSSGCPAGQRQHLRPVCAPGPGRRGGEQGGEPHGQPRFARGHRRPPGRLRVALPPAARRHRPAEAHALGRLHAAVRPAAAERGLLASGARVGPAGRGPRRRRGRAGGQPPAVRRRLDHRSRVRAGQRLRQGHEDWRGLRLEGHRPQRRADALQHERPQLRRQAARRHGAPRHARLPGGGGALRPRREVPLRLRDGRPEALARGAGRRLQ